MMAATDNSKLKIKNSKFEGLRVLDLTGLSGAYAPKLFADLGAEVVRVEPLAGDPLRRLGPFVGDESLAFAHYNAAKTCVRLDLDSDREEVLRLARAADVL